MVKKFTIYRLFDKREPEVTRYVGVTTNFTQRVAQHLLCDGQNPAKDAWIQTSGVEVGAEIIAVKWDRTEALLCEAYWINQYRNMGQPLTNQFIPSLSPRANRRVRTWKISLPEDSPVLQDLLEYADEIGQSLGETSRNVLAEWSRALRGQMVFRSVMSVPAPLVDRQAIIHNSKELERERARARGARFARAMANLDDDE